MKRMKYLGMLLSASLVLTVHPSVLMAAEATEGDASEEYSDILKDIPYADDGEEIHTLDLFGTQSYEEATPVIVEIHGGGYIGGSKEINTEHAVFYAEQGYIVVAPEYGKVPGDGDFRDTVQDLFSCYKWIGNHAEEYHFDLDNIFVSGDSAGGFYTLLTCAICSSEELQEYFEVEVPDYEFTEYVTSCPGTDILALTEDMESYVSQTIGEEILSNDELMSHLDLYSNVDASSFEGVYMLTTPGDVTTGSEVIKFDEYLTENGVEHTFVSYEATENDLVHVFNITKMEYSESQQANQDLVDYMNSLLK